MTLKCLHSKNMSLISNQEINFMYLLYKPTPALDSKKK